MRGSGLLLHLLVLVLLCPGNYGDEKHTKCAFLDQSPDPRSLPENGVATAPTPSPTPKPRDTGGLSNQQGETGMFLEDNKTMVCAPKHYCYSFWEANPKDPSNKTMLKQGCWEYDESSECQTAVCMRKVINQVRNNTFFCCCKGDMCNMNMSYEIPPTPRTSPIPTAMIVQKDPDYRQKTIIIALMSILLVSVVTIVAFLTCRLWLSSNKEHLESSVSLLEAPPTATFEPDQLKITELIERGRYGEVWRGTLNEGDVAVKIFGPHQKQYYLNEKDLYTLPHMEHPALPRYYGCDQRITSDGSQQYILVMTYITGGTLTAYLKEHNLDWVTLCKMCHSVASGLAHLHSDIIKGEKSKPAIAHRDFNTRNILVKADLTCCVCDFGFAMKIMGSKFFRNGQEENAESSSLTDVGTLRYMAPEVLEGAVNLRDCEASLKQIDVFALGLVLWEVASRCGDLYQGMPVPEYMLPFQAEVGAHPTFEEMQLLVSRNKQRPLFPDVWKDSNPAIRALKDTIEECWDPDAEARLTSLCVEERALEMTVLWEARQKGVTPTINPTGQMGNIADQSIIQRNPTSSHVTLTTSGLSGELPDRNGNIPSAAGPVSDSFCDPAGGGNMNRLSRYTDNSVSTSTTETTLTASPTTDSVSEPMPTSKGNRNLAYARANRVLQPHQGQNPTVERNTHKGSDEELAILGNTLVDKSKPDSQMNGMSSTLSDDLFDTIAENLESSLVQNDMLNQQRSAAKPCPNPHSHYQNPTRSQPMIVRPKQPNVPGNGSAPHPPKSVEPKQKPKFKFKKPKEKGRLSFPFFGKNPLSKSHHHNSGVENEDDYYPTENLRPQVALLKQMGHQRSRSDGGSNLCKSNLEPRPVTTEVCLMNGSTVVRPTSLPLRQVGASPALPPPPPSHHGMDIPSSENRLGIAEVGVAKLQQSALSGGQATMVRVHGKSQDNMDLNPSDPELGNHSGSGQLTTNDDTSSLQPSSLPLNGQTHIKHSRTSLNNISETNVSDNNNLSKGQISKPNTYQDIQANGHLKGLLIEDAQPMDKVKKRIKTPNSVKNGRYSLYSDRIMSHSAADVGPNKRDCQDPASVTKSSISLHQFGSIDVDLNKLEAADFRC